jgi:uncharacterized protein (TIGR02452 family)
MEVSQESVFEALQRIVRSRRNTHVVALNFGSPTEPGGGFLAGIAAQEGSIARASALYPSIQRHREMYQFGETQAGAPLKSDYMIYSPLVPFFRDDKGALLERPFLVSVITCAAPDANQVKEAHQKRVLPTAMKNRLRKIMQLAAEREDLVVVLGAFGCGTCGNDPAMVANCMKELLIDEGFGRYFEVVVNPTKGKVDTCNYDTFRRGLKE